MEKVVGDKECSAYWSKGFTHTDADANKVAKEMVVLDEGFTPQELVDLAEDPKKELHKCFTWDNIKAAGKWRKQEARDLCNHLRIEYVTKERKEEPERLTIKYYVKPSNTAKYESINTVINDEDKLDSYRQRMVSELKAVRTRYAILKADFKELFDMIDAL